MKLTYLGTAAAECWTALFCRCPYCRKAREAGGRNLRTRSQSIVNGDLLIDFPPDSMAHLLHNGLCFADVKNLIFTHSHRDHFFPEDIRLRDGSVYAHHLTEDDTLDIWGGERVMAALERITGLTPEVTGKARATTHLILPGMTFTAGRYTISTLRANHYKGDEAMNFVICDGEKTLLYLHDTGFPFDEVFEWLGANGIKANLISCDCTNGSLPSGWSSHMGLDKCTELKVRFDEMGVSGPDTIYVVNHFSHNGGLIYDDMVVEAAKLGFLTSYDGMTVEF